MKVREWYVGEFPSDECGHSINGRLTFKSLWLKMSSGVDFYEVIGVRDSIVRERIFGQMAREVGVTVDTIYTALCNA